MLDRRVKESSLGHRDDRAKVISDGDLKMSFDVMNELLADIAGTGGALA
jgi:hypothetical protein